MRSTTTPPDGIFKPTTSKAEAKSDVTTKAARSLIDTEAAARNAKTERLRAARKAQEAVEALNPAPVKKARKQPVRKA